MSVSSALIQDRDDHGQVSRLFNQSCVFLQYDKKDKNKTKPFCGFYLSFKNALTSQQLAAEHFCSNPV
jgi:hypothetical protein